MKRRVSPIEVNETIQTPFGEEQVKRILPCSLPRSPNCLGQTEVRNHYKKAGVEDHEATDSYRGQCIVCHDFVRAQSRKSQTEPEVNDVSEFFVGN